MTAFADIVGLPGQGAMKVVFLYVGQGEATLLLVPDGSGHKSVLVDCNRAFELGGIDLVRLLKDVSTDLGHSVDSPQLDYFINTHPHADHLGGLAELRDEIDIVNVWHSGHRPGPAHESVYGQLTRLCASLRGKEGHSCEAVLGSRSARRIGDAFVNVVAPAEHVTGEIDNEDANIRRKRIHEQCAVLRFSVGGESPSNHGVLITGDSDRAAWEQHITYYHGRDDDNRVAAKVLSASHHGSYTFFLESRDDAGETPFKAHMRAIRPSAVVVSAPDRKDSRHNHPHEEALTIYREFVGENGLLHMGSRGNCFIADFAPDGASYSIVSDDCQLVEEYGLGGSPDDSSGIKNDSWKGVVSRVERSRPMG